MLNNQVLDLKSQETIAARKIYPKALNLIERDQNFDEILKKTETISTAVHLLCPNLPGLPTKLRGKYQKRTALTDEEKESIMRQRNRENACRTRKRKQLYHAFIVSALADLLGLFYLGQASIVGFYFGATAYMSRSR